MPKKDNSSNDKKSEKKMEKSEKPEKKVESKKQIEMKVEEHEEGNDGNKVVKPGRTLLVSPASNGSSINESVVTGLTGLKNSFSTKNGSYFLTFDTIENSVSNFAKLQKENSDLKVKFSRYQIFFTIKGLNNKNDYTALKKLISEHVEQKTGGIVLYFKLYRRGDNYLFGTKGEEPIGYGDLTIDTKESMDLLLNKEGPLKNYELKIENTDADKAVDISGTFYRFNKNPKNVDGSGPKKAYIN